MILCQCSPNIFVWKNIRFWFIDCAVVKIHRHTILIYVEHHPLIMFHKSWEFDLATENAPINQCSIFPHNIPCGWETLPISTYFVWYTSSEEIPPSTAGKPRVFVGSHKFGHRHVAFAVLRTAEDAEGDDKRWSVKKRRCSENEWNSHTVTNGTFKWLNVIFWHGLHHELRDFHRFSKRCMVPPQL